MVPSVLSGMAERIRMGSDEQPQMGSNEQPVVEDPIPSPKISSPSTPSEAYEDDNREEQNGISDNSQKIHSDEGKSDDVVSIDDIESTLEIIEVVTSLETSSDKNEVVAHLSDGFAVEFDVDVENAHVDAASHCLADEKDES